MAQSGRDETERDARPQDVHSLSVLTWTQNFSQDKDNKKHICIFSLQLDVEDVTGELGVNQFFKILVNDEKSIF